jgi:serine/threonine-protein kinase HipA
VTTKIKRLGIGTPQGEAGVLVKESRFVFNYAARESACEISLTMPMRAESYSSGALLPIFEMNRPEGYLLAKIEEAFAKQGGLDDMRLLAIAGTAQIGRLTYTVLDVREPRERPGVGLREILAAKPTSELFNFLIARYFDSGVSGVQPKVLLPDTDRAAVLRGRATVASSNLIVKSSGDEYPHLTQNEYLCMSAAKAAGIPVPEFWLSDDGGLFVVERFDVREDLTLGFEDMAVLMNKPVRRKYEGSYENVAKAVRLYCAGADPLLELRRLFEYVAFIVMVRNGDGHLKNFGLLYEHPAAPATVRLAPLFDVVTTSLYGITDQSRGITKYDRTLALKLHRSRDYPDRGTLLEFGVQTCGVPRPEEVLERIGEAMSATLREQGHRVEPSLLAGMRKEWDAGRMSVEPARVFAGGGEGR